jgi:UbiD family decarboxylase
VPFEGLRDYLDLLEDKGLFYWVEKEVDKDWEIASVARMIFLGLPEERRFGIGFRNIRGHPGGRVVAGVVAASTRMIATALETRPEPLAIFERITQGIENPIPPVLVDSGPCKEVILRGDEVNLRSFPIPTWTPGKDVGPYLTPLWVTKDPETGERDIGIRRCQIKGPNKTGILFGAPDRYGAIHHAKRRERREPLPAALFIGVDPVIYLVGPSRFGMDELAVAGGIRRRPVELIRCETCDLEVPAAAEIVVEGEISTEEVEPEGPFGEFTGYMAGGRATPVFHAKCITRRKDPILLGLISQFPPSESSMIKRNLLEASLFKHLTKNLNIPGLADVHAIEAGGCTAMLWLSVKKMYPGHIDQLVFGVMGYFGMSYYKWIVVTDDDVDIRDPFMRDWVLSWRVQPDRDMRVLPNTAAVELDPSSMPPGEILREPKGAKAIIDATKKWEYPPLSLPPRERLEEVIAGWSRYELPPLDPVRIPKGL